MKNFIQRLIGFSVGPIIGAFIAFVTNPLLTHNIIPSEYGKASIFLTIYPWIQSFIFLGLDQAYTREFNEVTNEKDLLQNAILLPALISTILFLLILIFPTFFATLLYNNSDEILPTIAFGVFVIFIVYERFILLYIRMHERAFEYSLFNILLKASILIVTLTFLLLGLTSFHTVVYSIVGGQIVADLYLMIRYRKLFNIIEFKINPVLIGKMLSFGLPIMISAVVFSSLKALDRVFLRIYTDDATQGVYTATFKISGIINIVKSTFTSFWIPTAYRWYAEKKHIRNFKFISDLIMVIMTVAFFGIILFKEVVIIIIGSEYGDAIYLIGLLILPELLYTASETTTLGIVFSRKSHLNIFVSIISLIPTVALNWILTPKVGAVGAAISSCVGFLFFFGARTFFSNKTGFSFNVTRQFTAVTIMFSCAILNGFININMWTNLLFFIATLIVQMNVLSDIRKMKKDPSYIDLN